MIILIFNKLVSVKVTDVAISQRCCKITLFFPFSWTTFLSLYKLMPGGYVTLVNDSWTKSDTSWDEVLTLDRISKISSLQSYRFSDEYLKFWNNITLKFSLLSKMKTKIRWSIWCNVAHCELQKLIAWHRQLCMVSSNFWVPALQLRAYHLSTREMWRRLNSISLS